MEEFAYFLHISSKSDIIVVALSSPSESSTIWPQLGQTLESVGNDSPQYGHFLIVDL